MRVLSLEIELDHAQILEDLVELVQALTVQFVGEFIVAILADVIATVRGRLLQLVIGSVDRLGRFLVLAAELGGRGAVQIVDGEWC